MGCVIATIERMLEGREIEACSVYRRRRQIGSLKIDSIKTKAMITTND